MGIGAACCTEEEDLASEKASKDVSWKGIEGCYKSQPVFSLRERQEGSSVVPILCQGWVCCGNPSGVSKLICSPDIQQQWKQDARNSEKAMEA